MSKKLLYSAIVASAALLTIQACSAKQGGNEGGMGGNGCGLYSYTGGDCSVVWFKYTYTDQANSSNPQTWIPKSTNSGVLWGSAGHIGATPSSNNDECRKDSKTFYSKGVAMANSNKSQLYKGSQQFGLAAPGQISRTWPLRDKDAVNGDYGAGSGQKSYAYASNFSLDVVTGAGGITGDAYRPSGNAVVAKGTIVSWDTAAEAFCRAVDNDNWEDCMTNLRADKDVWFVTDDGRSFTFEGSTNQATWFCANDQKLNKAEELQSSSSVIVNDASDNTVASAYDVDGGDVATDKKENLAPGLYKYNRASLVEFEGDASTKNKVSFTQEMCLTSGIVSFTGQPTVENDHVSGSNSTASIKCTHYDPSETTYKDFLLFPGQSKTFSASVTHASKIKSSGGTVSKADDSTDEKSSASVTVVASKHLCWNDTRYVIGVNDKNNYYRLGLEKNSNGYQFTDVYPDDSSNTNSVKVWAKPDDLIRFDYDMCSGQLLADDAAGKADANTSIYYSVNSNSNLSDKAWIWDGPVATTKTQTLSVAGSRFGADARTRIANGYELTIESPTDTAYRLTNNELGATISNTLGVTSGEVKVPYNYILNPSLETGGEDARLTIGDTYTFDASIKTEARMNNGVGESYSTIPKSGTIRHAWLFVMDSSRSASVFNGLVQVPAAINSDGETDYYYVGDSSDSPINRLGITAGDIKNQKDININSTTSETLSYSVAEGLEVGTKVCAMVATWPADSHNDFTSATVSGNQLQALRTDAGDNPIWRFNIDCGTVGKKPNVSIEAGSLAVSGNVNTAKKKYGGKLFGSWVEYGLTANSVNDVTGSGASLSNGLQTGKFAIPQTLGNTSGNGGVYDAYAYYAMSSAFVDKIEGVFYEGNTLIDNSRVRTGDIAAGETGILFYKNAKNNETITIDQDIRNYSKDAVLVVFGDNIEIMSNVTRVDAVLIAKDKITTCAGHSRNDADGNMDLKENCAKQLVVNGAIYAGGDNGSTASDKVLSLYRTYGGGNIDNGYLDSSTLPERAEIFNYDPRIVKQSYELMKNIDSYAESYVQELAPRY
jgi:hypothetical protein